MELYKNMLIEWSSETGQTQTERLLHFDDSRTNVATIDIFDPHALPSWRKYSDIELSLSSGEARHLMVDPFAKLCYPEREIKKKHRKIRNNAYKSIATLVERDDLQLLDPRTRGSLVNEISKGINTRKATIYDRLRHYWQRGQTKNALLPLFDQCGWRDRDLHQERKKKNVDKELNIQGQVKLGRPTKLSKRDKEPRGVNVDEDIRKKFRWGIKLFYTTRLVKTLQEAHQRTLEHFFKIGYERNRNGTNVPILPPAEELPSYPQFTYWHRKERKPKHEIIAREGETRYNLSNRPSLGDATQMAFGPGSIYQIDATIGDIYLVSSLDPSCIIGRPVIYLVIDTFSHLITGISVTLEGPSWVGAMLAIENAAADKVAFCEEYGITIDESEWPSCEFPEGLLADRGELEGYNADHLVNAFGMRIHNTSPYRGDMKGLVEQHIDILQEKGIRWTPGEVRKRERGDRDYRLDALLNLHQLRKLLILCVLEHNNHHRIDKYRMDQDMIADHVEPYPIDLWNWGIRNRSGHLRKIPTETLRLNLLPEFDATVTDHGLRYNNLHYVCDQAIEENWFDREKGSSTKTVKVVGDPRNMQYIYLLLKISPFLLTFHLKEADKTFIKRDLYETLEYFELRAQANEASRTRQQRSQAELNANKDSVIAEAREGIKDSLDGQSDRSRIGAIRENKKQERELERQTSAWRLDEAAEPTKNGEANSTEQAKKSSESGYVPPVQPMDKLRELRERRLQK